MGTVRLLQRRICARLQVAQVGENAFLEFLRILDGPAESLEPEGQASHNVGAGDVEEVVPEDARDVFTGW